MSKDFIILEGKDLNQLIEEGLKILKKDKEEVNIEILERGKTLMGVSIKDYKIKISLKESLIDNYKELELAEKSLEEIADKVSKNDFFHIKYLEDGVYLIIEDREVFNSNAKYVLDFIRKKRITNVDIRSIEEALSSRDKNEFRIAPKQEEMAFDAELVIDISEDKLSAYATLLPPDGGKELDFDSALEKIREQIKYGLDENVVKTIICEKLYNTKHLIAKGIPHIDGEDGQIKYLFPVKSSTTPRILEDGSADFRNLDIIHNVKAGDILAELIYPTEGKEGITVLGETIQPKQGKKVEFKYGKNVKVSEDGKLLIAEKDGQVSLENDKVIVKEVLEIKNNVDNSTGNIRFNGAIKIKGNVLTGFEVNAEGDIEIEGVVEGAKIISLGNIFLKRGIQGYNKGKLISQGSIVARYIENSYIESGDEVVADAIMHSEVTSGTSVKVLGKKGLIVGGICRASTEIIAKTIGSTMATVTILEVGVDPYQRANQGAIKAKIEEAEANIEKLNKTITLLNRLMKNGALPEEKKELLNKSILTKNSLIENVNNLKKQLSNIEKQIEALSRGKIRVQNVIYPGVKITIGNSTMFVRDEIKYCTIYLENNEIKIGPYDF